MPSPVFIAALLTTERLRIVRLPNEINSADEQERDRIVQDEITKHYRASSGRVPAFGRIEGYYFVRFPGFGGVDFGTPFDCHGSATGPMVSVRRLPEATLGVGEGDTPLTGLLSDTPISILDLDLDE